MESTLSVTLSPQAHAKVTELIAKQEERDLALRIYVKPGGCSGFSYGMGLGRAEEGDEVIEQDGLRIVIDPRSAPYLNGIEIDYREALMGGGFSIKNPNAVSACGCGSSFRTKEEAGAPGACGH